MAAFVAANILAAETGSYWSLMGARILLAFAAGLYVPNANALAAVLVHADKRGSALAIVNGGLTLSLVFGVPLGTVVGNQLGWRTVFWGIAILALLATVGLLIGLPLNIGRGLPSITMHDRIALARKPEVLIALVVTILWATGVYTNYTYLAPYLYSVTGIRGAGVGVILLTWGVGAAVGVFGSGALIDRFGTRPVITMSFLLLTATFLSLSTFSWFLSPAKAAAPVFISIAVWGISSWAFVPSQFARLVSLSGTAAAPIALSLNASLLYLGISCGAVVGSIVLAAGSVSDLGWVGAVCEVAALGLFLISLRDSRRLATMAHSAD
jgi:predicted MFS family arabinose efflux permease